MPTPSIPYVVAGRRNLASDRNSIKDYLDYLLNPPGVHAYRTAVGTIANNAWSGAIGMDGEDYDRDGMHDTSSNNSRITFQTDGRYVVRARLQFTGNATGYRALEVKLNANGLQANGSLMARDTCGPTATFACLECSFSRVFSAGDYIEMFCFQNSGAGLGLNTGIRQVAIESWLIGTN